MRSWTASCGRGVGGEPGDIAPLGWGGRGVYDRDRHTRLLARVVPLMASQGHTVPRCCMCGVPLGVDDAHYNACPTCLVREFPEIPGPFDPDDEDIEE